MLLEHLARAAAALYEDPCSRARLTNGPNPLRTGNLSPVNYLARANVERVPFLPGDANTFSEIINLIDEYCGTLYRLLSSFFLVRFLGVRLLRLMQT
jgi:hypothetical protein